MRVGIYEQNLGSDEFARHVECRQQMLKGLKLRLRF
jgi:hypothetical protein